MMRLMLKGKIHRATVTGADCSDPSDARYENESAVVSDPSWA